MPETQKIELFTPKYDGPRFEEHRLPLELVEDLVVLRDMTIEMAKQLYLEKNPERQRVPRNFTHGISIELESINEGSTIPKVVLVTALSGLFPISNSEYFQEAPKRIEGAIHAAHTDGDINTFASEKVLNYFNQFGKKLRDEERIIFTPAEPNKAVFTKESRKKLILASSKAKEYTEEIVVRGFITELDKDRMTFEIQLINGVKVGGNYGANHLEIIQEAFLKLEEGQKIALAGTGNFSSREKLQSIEMIEEVSLLDSLDVPSRLEELAFLKEGWLDGYEGVPLDRSGLNWLSSAFDNNFNSENAPLPATFPTPEGNIQMEWSINEVEASLWIDLTKKIGKYHSFDFTNDKEVDANLDLSNEEGWNQFNQLLAETKS